MKAILFSLLLLPGLHAMELTWDDVDARTEQAHELLEQREAIERIHRQAEARTEQQSEQAVAYRALGEALARHPEMAEANEIDREARQSYQEALASGDPESIHTANVALAEAKAFRYRTAASIPELKALIDAWQQAQTAAPAAGDDKAALERLSLELMKLRGDLIEVVD